MEVKSLISDPFGLYFILIAIPALIFLAADSKAFGKIFKVVPVLVFAYFIPTLLAGMGVIPSSDPAYGTIKRYVLPMALFLLTLPVDLKAILKMGPVAVTMFLVGTVGIIIGGPISLFVFQNHLPQDIWKGMAALAGSWIGGGANFVALGQSVGTTEAMMGMMVVVDVACASIWTAVLMFMAGRYRDIDAKMGADNRQIEELKDRVSRFEKRVQRVASAKDYFCLFGLAFGVTWICDLLGGALPELGYVISHTTWKIVLVTTFALILSFTRLRDLDGVGASKFGSVMLYMLIGTIGAGADFMALAEYPYLFAAGMLWLLIHAVIMIVAMRLLKAPVFFMAVGSQANVGGAASAPIVASAFHPTLASVGALLGVLGYLVGTYGAILCAKLLLLVAGS